MRKSRKGVRFGTICLFLLAATATAQNVQLSLEQQRMLNQLPASQRAAALQQLGNLQATQDALSAATAQSPTTVIALPQSPTEEPERLPVFGPGDTLVLAVQVREPVSESNELLRLRMLGGNPYQLDELGQLVIPGVGELAIAGLTEEQAMLRLNADPALAGFSMRATLLPLQPVGTDALRPFGYDLFQRGAERLSPNAAVPVAADYIVGAGDVVRVQLFGNQNMEYELPVDRDGTIRFPEIGPLSVAGLSYVGLQDLIGQRVREQFIGTQVSVTLGELRALQIFVMGDVRSPGSYAVSPMSTITSALAQSGGIANHGSMRRVQLKRGGQLVQILDVYDLLLRGDTRSDVRLRAGDVVFVPPVGTRVTVAGEVNRPAIYEYIGAANVEDVIGLAGGLTSKAYRAGVKIERFEPDSGLRVVQAGQDDRAGRGVKVHDGDTVVVPAGVAQLEESVILAGNLQRPGEFQWRPGLRISDLITNSRDLKDGSDLNYLLIRREAMPNAELAVVSVDLEAAWRQRGGDADVVLEPRDTVYVFDLEVGRGHIVEPLIAELRQRTSRHRPLAVARIGGQVNAAGEYPIEAGMRISDLVRAGGGLAEAAYVTEAEITRYVVIAGEERETELLRVDLQRALSEDSSADLSIQPFDYLNIKEIPRWRDQAIVDIRGEIAFPGRYPIRQGETLTSVIRRAGGLTELAFPGGSVFTRDALRQREREQVEVLARRIESDLSTMAISDPERSEAISIGQSLLRQLRESQPVGRLVIDLNRVLAGYDNDVILRDGDSLLIPVEAQEVTVLGEVQYATSHLYDPSLTRDEYINKSGGATRKADARNTYVVRANGEVSIGNRSRFFTRSRGVGIEPGDTIVVPLHVDRVRPITLWTSATQVVYNLAIAAAAVNSF